MTEFGINKKKLYIPLCGKKKKEFSPFRLADLLTNPHPQSSIGVFNYLSYFICHRLSELVFCGFIVVFSVLQWRENPLPAMENSAYIPSSAHLNSPALVVFSQATGGLPDALRLQRPFNPQVTVIL